MTAQLVAEDANETVQQGFVELGVQQQWLVITSARNVPFTTVLQDPSLPVLGSAQVFGTATLYCISRVPSRQDSDATGRKWYVACNWSNNQQQFARDQNGLPVSDPTAQVKTVDIQYLEYSEPITDAKIKNVTNGAGYIDPATGVPNGLILATPPYIPTTAGPVKVSTGEVVTAERVAYRQTITVSRVERGWESDYEDYTNTLNELELVISESDATGILATYTYAPLTLRMKPISKVPIWHDTRMYFRITFAMEHNALTWVHSEADISQKRRVFYDAGGDSQRKPDGEKYTQEEVDAMANPPGSGLEHYIAAITTGGGDSGAAEVAVGDPQPLNGYGAEMPIDRADGTLYNKDSVYMNYDVYEIKDWTALNL